MVPNVQKRVFNVYTHIPNELPFFNATVGGWVPSFFFKGLTPPSFFVGRGWGVVGKEGRSPLGRLERRKKKRFSHKHSIEQWTTLH